MAQSTINHIATAGQLGDNSKWTFTEKEQQKISGRWLLSCIFDITPGIPDFPGGNVTLDTTYPQSYEEKVLPSKHATPRMNK